MSITDELREYAQGYKNSHDAWSGIGDKLDKIADRIDAEHEEKVSYWQGACYEDGYKEGLADNEDATAEHGWVKLPVDADGVPFRIGDKVDSDHYEDGTVTGIQFYKIYNGGIRTLIAVRPDGWDVATWRTPDEYRHNHEPTVEDVLREFFSRYVRYVKTKPEEEDDAIIAEYAAKLRLAGDA